MPDDEKTKLLWWVIGAFLASIGVNQGIQKNFTVRDKPFTSDDGAVLRIQTNANKRGIERIGKRLDKHELRLDSVQVFTGGIEGKMRSYVDQEFKSEAKECAKYRRDIERRLSRFEYLQESVVQTLRNYGVNLEIRGPKK